MKDFDPGNSNPEPPVMVEGESGILYSSTQVYDPALERMTDRIDPGEPGYSQPYDAD